MGYLNSMRRGIPRQIVDRILAEFISNNRISSGGRLPSVREFAEMYNCSNSSITHALANLEQSGAIVRKHGDGCFVSETWIQIEIQTQSSRSDGNLIGLVGPSSDSELIIDVYSGVEKIAQRSNLHVLVANSNFEYESERWQVERLIQAGCRAIALYPVTRTAKQLNQDYLRSEFRNMPIVLIGNALPEQCRTRVVFDNYTLGYMMTEHLLQLGHRSIAIMDNYSAPDCWIHYAVRERVRGYHAAMSAAGATIAEQDVWNIQTQIQPMQDADVAQIRIALQRWKQRPGRSTAVIAIEDHMALQAVCAAHDLGIDVPRDLLVAGFDNRSIGRSYRPAFPTSNPDFRYAGELAARLAIEMAAGEGGRYMENAPTYIIPVPLLPRGSHRQEIRVPAGVRIHSAIPV